MESEASRPQPTPCNTSKKQARNEAKDSDSEVTTPALCHLGAWRRLTSICLYAPYVRETYSAHAYTYAAHAAHTKKRLITEWLPWLHGLCQYQRLTSFLVVSSLFLNEETTRKLVVLYSYRRSGNFRLKIIRRLNFRVKNISSLDGSAM